MRHETCFPFLIAFVLLLVCLVPAEQQNPSARPPAEPLAARQVRGAIYQVTGGSGANTGFFIGASEVLVIDAKMSAESAGQMLAEIRKLSDKPLRAVVLTHSDGDHVNGLAGFPAATALIAQENCRRDMLQAQTTGTAQLPLPTETFSQRLTLYLGDTEVRLLYFGPAHTDGDVVVFFPAAKVAFVGDLLFVGRDPLIHLQKNGSSFGLVAVLKSLLQLDADIFLNGHGEPLDKQGVAALLVRIEEKQAKVRALVAAGKSLEDVKKALNEPEQPTVGGRRWPSLTEIIYRELTEKK